MSAISTGESRGADKRRRWTRAKRVACSLAFAATLAWAPDDAVRGETASEATERRTKLAAEYFVKAQRPDGLFDYHYDFVRGRLLEGENMVRQAGATFALAEYYRATRDDDVRDALARAIEGLDRLSVPHGPGRVVARNRELHMAKTGATALALLAELLYSETTGDPAFADARRDWLRALLALRRRGGGFVVRPGRSKESPYFSGEAWLALAHYERLFPADAEVRRGLAELDGYLIDRYGREPHVGFFHWGVMAAAVRYRVTGETRFKDFIRDQAAAFLERLRPTVTPHSNACYSVEGLAAAAITLGREGEEAEPILKPLSHRIDIEIEKSLGFQILPGQSELRFGEGRYLHAGDLAEFVGAFVNGLYRPTTRIDFTQHCLSALLKYTTLQSER